MYKGNKMSETCMIFFKSESCDKDAVVKSLLNYKFEVENKSTYLLVSKNKNPKFKISLITESYVQEEAIDISNGTEYSVQMSRCNARYEIYIENLDEALNEANALMEVQGAIQDASKGYLFTPWNNNLEEPWIE